MSKSIKRIEIYLDLKEDGTCSTNYCEDGEEVIAKMKAMKESGEEFDIDSLNAVEKAFATAMHALYSLTKITEFVDGE